MIPEECKTHHLLHPNAVHDEIWIDGYKTGIELAIKALESPNSKEEILAYLIEHLGFDIGLAL